MLPILFILSLSSKTNQMGTTCELPSFLTVASFPVSVPFIRNFLISRSVISAIKDRKLHTPQNIKFEHLIPCLEIVCTIVYVLHMKFNFHICADFESQKHNLLLY